MSYQFNRSSRGSFNTSSSFSRQNTSRRRPSRRPYFHGNTHINQKMFVAKADFQNLETYVPKNTFMDFEVDSSLKESLNTKGFTIPTAIQDQSIPLILGGKDLVGLANTGTGKTIAFLVPTINKVLKLRREGVETSCIIITPTRELALQVEQELINITSREMRIFSVCCVGGSDIRSQISKLRKPNQFIIGTPGRIMDLMERKILKLDNCSTIILDEADRMLDMGFIDDIRQINSTLPEGCQHLFFSATFNDKLRKICSEFLTDPISISVKTSDSSKNVDQDIVKVSRSDSKVDTLHDLLIKDEFKKVLIFTATKMGADELADELRRRKHYVEVIHGGKTQGLRKKVLSNFKKQPSSILIATDVAARGLDVDNITHVINFEIPENYETYVHRIGRTGRNGKVGHALTFIEE
jgi:ATP-dependent RNA helicase RhlE